VQLAHFEGSDAATSTSDEIAGVTHALTNWELDTAQAKFGSSSVVTTANAGTDEITGISFDETTDWTFECFMRTSDGNALTFGLFDDSNNVCCRVLLDFDGSSSSCLAYNSTPSIILNSSGGSPGAFDTWHHVAVCRNASAQTMYWFYDGTRVSTNSVADNIRTPTKMRLLTSFYVAATGLWVDELRLSQTLRYADAASLTVPTAAFTVD